MDMKAITRTSKENSIKSKRDTPARGHKGVNP